MYKAYKFRLYPNKEQKELLNKSFGCTRFIYNYYLGKSKENGYLNPYAYIQDYVNNLKYEYPFLIEVDSILIRKSIFNLDNAYQRYFKDNTFYPKFKSKYSRNSYTTNAIYSSYKNKKYCNIEVDLEKRMIKLPKLKWINIRGYRNLKELPGKIISSTISREHNSKYYVSIVVEVPEVKYKIVPRSIVGIDLGIKKLLILSDNTTFDNNRYIEKYEKRIKRIQKELCRKVKRSNNYYKCKNKLAILYSKLKNARKYYLHNITKKIIEEYDIITCEKLNTKSMLKNNKLSKKISDASFYEIIKQLQYKSKYKGKYFYQIDTYYKSSQTCSICNKVDSSYKDLSKRTYKCSNCKMEIDRDINASNNIMFEGLKIYMKEKLLNI